MKGLILTYLIVGCGTLGALRWPAVGVYVYVGLAVLRPQFVFNWAGDLSNLSLIVGTAMLAGWFFHGFGSWRFGRGRAIVMALGAFTIWSCLSAIQARNPAVSLENLRNLAKIVLPFLVGVSVLESERDARTLLWIIVGCQGYLCYEMNASYYFQGYNQIQDVGFGGLDNNCVAISLVSTVGCAAALGLSAKKWWERGLAAAAALLILHATLLTFSRGGILGLIAVAVAGVIIMPKRPLNIVAVLVLALVGLRLTGPELAARFETTFAASDARDYSAESRVQLWGDCVTVALSYPVFGVGPDNWGLIVSDFGWPPGKQAHSAWMQEMAEVGFLGVLALILFYGITAVKLWPMARTRSRAGPQTKPLLAAGIVMSIVGYMVSAQFVSLPGLEIPFYIVMAAVILLKEPSPAAEVKATVPAPDRPTSLRRSAFARAQTSAFGWDRLGAGPSGTRTTRSHRA